MFDLTILIIITIILLFLIFKFIKKVLHLVISIILLFILFCSIFTILIVMDIGVLQKDLIQKDNIILLSNGSNFLTGAYIKVSKYINTTNPQIINNNRIINNIEQFDTLNYKDILKENFKLIIVNIKFLEDNLNQNIDYKDYKLNKGDVISILNSQDPILELSNTLNIPKESINQNKGELKFSIFSLTLDKIIKEQGLSVIIRGYKSKQIMVYKETIFFKVLKLTPSNYINKYITN